MKSILLFGLCFTLSLVLVFGSVNSPYSFTLSAFASDEGHTTEDSGGGNNNHGDDNLGGDTGDQGNDQSDGSHGMPPPEDAPATAGGGGSDDDDDEADNDNNDNDDDNDNDNPQIPKDAPPTSDALTAKKLECLPGQEVTLFSTTCEPTGGEAGGTQGSTSAATVCPTSPTPTSYGMSGRSSVTNTVWGYSEPETDQRETQKSLLHRIQSPNTESKPADTANCIPPGILPFRGDEPKLIDSYAMPVPDPNTILHIDKTNLGRITFVDHTIRTSTKEPNLNPYQKGEIIDNTIITPGPRTPLDQLQVDRVVQTSVIDKNGNRVHTLIKIEYKEGAAITYPSDLQSITVDDGKGNKQDINFYPNTGDTIVTKSDRSYTVYPKVGNAYTVYPRAADGTQKTVTMTSQGEPILTVRDANNNIIPPKQ